MSSPDDSFPRREFVFKILVIGDPATGKTCIVKRTIQNSFSEHYKATVKRIFSSQQNFPR